MKSFLKQFIVTLSLTIFISTGILLAQKDRAPITPDDYAQWQNLSTTAISSDGNWIAYRITLVEGDDTLYVKNINGDKEYKYPLSSSPKFSMNSEWIGFRIGYSEKKLDKMKEKKETVKYKMGLLSLKSGKEETFKNVKAFTFSETGNFLAMQIYKPKDKESKGADLIVKDLKTGFSRNIGNVSEYAFNKKGDKLAYIIDADGQSGNGVELFDHYLKDKEAPEWIKKGVPYLEKKKKEEKQKEEKK